MLPNIEKTKIFQLYSLSKKTIKTFVSRQYLSLINQVLHFTAHFQPITFTLLPLFARNHAIPNIVGYQEFNLDTAGFHLFSTVFEGCGRTMNLQDLKLENADAWGGVNIQMLNLNGDVSKTYQWWLAEDSYYTVAEDGWYDMDDTSKLATDVNLELGAGFYIYTPAGGAKFCTSGCVKKGELVINLQKGYNLFGNSTPGVVYLKDIVIEDSEGWGGDNIQMLNSNGDVEKTYQWWSAEKSFYTVAEDGWYDMDDTSKPANEVTFEPGQGLYINVEGSRVLRLPSVLAE